MGWRHKSQEDDPNEGIFARNKYRELKVFAESSQWLKLQEMLEDDDHYPGVAYLTQSGSVVHFFIDGNCCEIEMSRSAKIKIAKSDGKEILQRLAGGG